MKVSGSSGNHFKDEQSKVQGSFKTPLKPNNSSELRKEDEK